MRRSALVLALPVALAVACEANNPPPAAPVPPTSPVSTDAPAAGAGNAAASPAAPDAGPPPFVGGAAKMCGCSLCDPVFSDDPCAADADCAPKTPCHATACVAKAKAAPRPPDTMCTQDLRCDSVDANACGCLRGRCALYPRKP